jgi:presenilin-like A22 family membrane protease
MRHQGGLIVLCAFYSLTMLLGLHTASFILPLMYPAAGEETGITPIVSDPQSVWSAAEILMYMLFGTALILVLISWRLGIVIKVALLFSFFAGTLFTFEAFVGEPLALVPALLFPLLSLVRKDDTVTANLALMFTISGVGALLGASLTVLPALILMVLASVYDYLAVFWTKHMVTLAKESMGKYTMMFLIPVEGRVMGLGAGDVALPLTFTTSVLAAHGAAYAIPVAFGGLLGVVSIFYYLRMRKNVTLPALPPISAGLLIGYGLCRLVLG